MPRCTTDGGMTTERYVQYYERSAARQHRLKSYDEHRFREDGSFRVLQMADVQDGPDVLPDTIRLIREAAKPIRILWCSPRRPDPRL